MKEVLLVGNFLSEATGVRSVCEDLAGQLAASGWRIITTSNKLNRVARLKDMVQVAWGQRYHYGVAQVDVYSGPAFLWAEVVCWVLRWANKPYVLTLHGGNLPAFAQRWPGRVRRLLRSAVAVTTPSRYLLEKLHSFGNDLQLLPNPLDLSHYPFRLRSEPQPRLVWLRAFHHLYNPRLAIQVLAQLAPKLPTVHLFMVGPDKGDGSFQATQRLAAALGVQERVTWPGGVTKSAVPAWLNKGDIFINTSTADNAPVSVVEAMACGLCVVSTNVGGIPYLLSDGVEALLVPSDSPVDMSDAVGRLLAEPGLAAACSRQAKFKSEQWDWAAILPQWERLLLSVQ